MGCLNSISACLCSFAGLFSSRGERSTGSKQSHRATPHEKEAAPHDANRFMRNPLLDMPAGVSFPVGIALSGSTKRFEAPAALRDDKITHHIVAKRFAVKHKIKPRQDISGLPKSDTDSSGTLYHLEAYFIGNWKLLNTHTTTDGYFAITVDPLPDDVDVLLRVDEAELGKKRAAAEKDHVHTVHDPKATESQRIATEQVIAAQAQLEKQQDASTHRQSLETWTQKLKKPRPGIGQGNPNQ